MKQPGKTAAYAVLFALLAAVCSGFTACGKTPPQSDGLVPMETVKSYEHVAKTESTNPSPTGGAVTPGVDPGGDLTGTVTPEPTAPVQGTGDGTAGEDIVYVAVSKLNLRAEPSMDSEVIAQAKYGDVFVRTEKGTGEWDKLLYEGRDVYAFAKYLTDQKISGAGGNVSGQWVADVKKK